MSEDLLKKLEIAPFRSLPLLSKGSRQTLASYYFPDKSSLCDKNAHIVPLKDGDKISVIENCPLNWRQDQRIVLLIHGLTGSHRSKYMIRIGRSLYEQGYLVIRMNLRGCGTGLGHAKYPYHSGRSEDVRSVLRWLQIRYPNSPVTQIGFSLGANILLKLAGEDGSMPTANLDSTIAISPPLDLYESVKLIIDKKNRLFDQHFLKTLVRDTQQLHRLFPELPTPDLSKLCNLYEFDEVYTAPRSGFDNALDYYKQCSSLQFIDKITIPTFILYAKDDPVVHHQAFLNLPQKPHIDILVTNQGGHVGWLGYTGKFGRYRWMDRIVLQWVKWVTRMR